MSHDAVNILLVEDDAVDVMAVKRGLEQNHIANPVTVAEDGLVALDILRGENGRKRLEKPYLILLDLNMPRMNGREFLEEIRSDPDLHDSIVFVLTTSSDERDIVAAYEKHVAGYITKKTAGEDFKEVVTLLGIYRMLVVFPGGETSPVT